MRYKKLQKDRLAKKLETMHIMRNSVKAKNNSQV